MDWLAPADRRAATRTAAGVAGVVLLLLLVTSLNLPMTWDEGDTLDRVEQIHRGEWPYTLAREGHPPLSGLLAMLGQAIGSGWLPPLTAARLGPILLFAVAAGAMAYRLGRSWSLAAGLAGSAALMLIPRLFAHAHFVVGDGPLAAARILTWAVFPAAAGSSAIATRSQDGLNRVARWAWVWPVLGWGAAMGLCLSVKATGWLAPLPFLAYGLIDRRWPVWRAILVGLPLAVVVFCLLNPPLWTQPIDGLAAFLARNLGRANRPDLNVATQFLGRMYDLHHTLPWYNTLLWTVATVPIVLLVFAVTGLATIWRRPMTHLGGVLLSLNFALLLIVRALPGVPPHDGVRLFLPVFAFLAGLAGIGVHATLGRVTTRWAAVPDIRRKAGWAIVGLYAVVAVNLIVHRPQYLSYYSPAVGGLPGAAALGMEPTYWWDALDDEVLAWLHANTAEGQSVAFGAPSPQNLRWMLRWGRLRRHVAPPGSDALPVRWYVVQHRPSAWQPVDRWLLQHARPVYRKELLGVPLLSVYDHQDWHRARRAVGSGSAAR